MACLVEERHLPHLGPLCCGHTASPGQAAVDQVRPVLDAGTQLHQAQ